MNRWMEGGDDNSRVRGQPAPEDVADFEDKDEQDEQEAYHLPPKRTILLSISAS